MKTTLDLPEELLKDAEASAASRGVTLHDYIAGALESRLQKEKPEPASGGDWRSVFGAASAADVAVIDEIVTRDLETIEADDWR